MRPRIAAATLVSLAATMAAADIYSQAGSDEDVTPISSFYGQQQNHYDHNHQYEGGGAPDATTDGLSHAAALYSRDPAAAFNYYTHREGYADQIVSIAI